MQQHNHYKKKNQLKNTFSGPFRNQEERTCLTKLSVSKVCLTLLSQNLGFHNAALPSTTSCYSKIIIFISSSLITGDMYSFHNNSVFQRNKQQASAVSGFGRMQLFSLHFSLHFSLNFSLHAARFRFLLLPQSSGM